MTIVLPAGDIHALRESSLQWNKMSASMQADIPQQPAMLKGGSLRDYQMTVGLTALLFLIAEHAFAMHLIDAFPSKLEAFCNHESMLDSWHRYWPCFQGLRWMVALHDHGLNGILADEMVLTPSRPLESPNCAGAPSLPQRLHSAHACFIHHASLTLALKSLLPCAGAGEDCAGNCSAGFPHGGQEHQRPLPHSVPLLCAAQLGSRAAYLGAQHAHTAVPGICGREEGPSGKACAPSLLAQISVQSPLPFR